jgi:hypothetical protein
MTGPDDPLEGRLVGARRILPGDKGRNAQVGWGDATNVDALRIAAAWKAGQFDPAYG